MVYFSIFGDDFSVYEVTEKLSITPTQSYKKGDSIPNRSSNMVRKETSWGLATGYQVSLDVNNQLQQIIQRLLNKELIINE